MMQTTFNLANTNLRAGKLAPAIEAYRSLISANPGFAPYYQNLAAAHARNADHDEALRSARMALCYDPRASHTRHVFDTLRRARRPARTGPALSVVVPVHNTQDYLEQCIRSILEQEFTDLELIAVDDGSTDRSRSILERFARTDRRVVLIRNDRASGNPGTPRNQALELARGEYLGFVDSDDWIDRDYYARLMRAARDDAADIVFSGGFKNHVGQTVTQRKYGGTTFSDVDADFYKYHESFMLWDKVFRRDLIEQFSIRLGETRAAVDVPFIFRAYFFAQAVSYCDGLLGYNYRRETPTSVTVNFRKGSSCDFEFQAYRVIDIKRLTSYVYTLGLISPESFDGFYDRARAEIARIDRSAVEMFARSLKKGWVLKGYDSILRSAAADYYRATRADASPAEDSPPPGNKFHLQGSKPGVAFFPAWLQANPYQEMFYRALHRATGRRVAGFAPEALDEALLQSLKGRYEYLHFHWLHVFLNADGGGARLLALVRRARALGFRIAYTAHNIVSHESPDVEDELRARRELVRHFDVIIAHGEVARARLVEQLGADPGSIRLMRHGTYRGYYANTVGRQAARARLGLRDDEFVFLSLGAIRGYKGIAPLIDAFSSLRPEAPHARLLIAGRVLDEGVEAQIRSRLDSRDDRIVFRPEFVENDDVQLYLNACDAFVLPYERVLTSGAAMLALSFERPIIAPRAGVLPEYVSNGIGELFDDYEHMRSIMRDWHATWASGAWAERFRREDFAAFCELHDWDALVRNVGM
jgi:glycosyltransferase involved in cell wall biosynthesis